MRDIFPVLIFLNVFFYLFGKFDVGGVSRPVCDDVCFERIPYQSEVAYHIQELMTCRLIRKPECQVVENAGLTDFDICLVKDF